MILETLNHTYKYEAEKICRIYFQTAKIVFSDVKNDLMPGVDLVRTQIIRDGGNVIMSCTAFIDGKQKGSCETFSQPLPFIDISSAEERALARVMTEALTSLTGTVPPWGILTGVRPSKLMRKYMSEYSYRDAFEYFTDYLKVSPEKAALAAEVAKAENACIQKSTEKSFSLYISIPFCPTRCSYCSFVSHSIAQAKKLMPDYVRLLCDEIRATAETAKKLSLKPETVYIGGGTPTSLDADSLKKITDTLTKSFDMSEFCEFTVEAGRPDTIDREKLRVLKNAGVTRISINPQTFCDGVLEKVGRPHTALDTVEKYRLAREEGFDNINMDLIAGLPSDTPEGFFSSLRKACELSPENITVHTLALKSASDMASPVGTNDPCVETSRMLSFALGLLPDNGYKPYYMYRQSKSVGNLENTGWCKQGRECLYNIYMMEEIHTVLACGAGAVTKLKAPNSDKIERVYNYKYPYEYISRFGDMLERKKEIEAFYAEYPFAGNK